MFGRMITLVPFVSFIVLVGNIIAISSDSDMGLLNSTLLVIKPVAENSPAALSLFEVCQKFYRIAEILVNERPNDFLKLSHTDIRAAHDLTSFEDLNSDFNLPVEMDLSDYKFPMSQQDWDGVMKDFDMEFSDVNAGEMAMFMEPYM